MGRKGESTPADPVKDSSRRIAMFTELRKRWAEEYQSPKHASHELNQKAYLKALPGLKALLSESVTGGWEENMVPSEIVAALDEAIAAIEDTNKEEGSKE